LSDIGGRARWFQDMHYRSVSGIGVGVKV